MTHRERSARLALIAIALLTLGGAVAKVSSVIYPEPLTRGLRFSHSRHNQTPCGTCHPSTRTSVSVADRNLPSEALCRPCHAQTRRSDAERKGPSERCAVCHAGHDGTAPPARTYAPSAHLRFGHRPHLERGAECQQCHRFDEQRPLPAMGTCSACHRNRGASSRCTVCHLTGKDGRLSTEFPEGRLVPRDGPAGLAHGQDFPRKHAAVAKARRDTCESCHQPSFCLRCHGATLRPMSIHVGDYISRHAQDARRDQPRCQSCHRTQTFCLGCHQRLGVGMETSLSGFRPSTTARFHPSGFTALTPGPAHHRYAARRNIRTCSSCHREETCVRCHGTVGTRRGGISPHGAGFRASSKCRAVAARNQRACVKCHVLGDQHLDCR